MTTEQSAVTLRGAGLRVTAPRIATLEAVIENPHSHADDIWEKVRTRLGAVSRQAVYDVLKALTEAGLVRRVHLDGRGFHYEWQSGDNHHHLVCTSCGRFEDIPCSKGEAPCLAPEQTHGYTVEIAEVLYKGLCSNCQTKTNTN